MLEVLSGQLQLVKRLQQILKHISPLLRMLFPLKWASYQGIEHKETE